MKEQLPSNPLSDADTLAEIRARDSRYQLERWSNWVAHDRRWLLAYIERLQCSIDEPKTDDYKCPFCDRPRDAEGSIWHAPDCEGLQNAGITKLQLHMLTTRAAVPPKVNASCEQQARDLLCRMGFDAVDMSAGELVELANLINDAPSQRTSEPPSDVHAKLREAQERISWAWSIIANVSGGDWSKQSQDWQDAAAQWEQIGDPYEGLASRDSTTVTKEEAR